MVELVLHLVNEYRESHTLVIQIQHLDVKMNQCSDVVIGSRGSQGGGVSRAVEE